MYMFRSLQALARRVHFAEFVLLSTVTVATGAWAGTLENVISFNDADGSCPRRTLVRGNEGSWYGITSGGGQLGGGTVFRLDSARRIKTIHHFSPGRESIAPVSLIRAANGRLYGTTYGDFGVDGGSIFVVAGNGRASLIYRFEGGRGAGPLMQASDGNFYGTLDAGGVFGFGLVYTWSPGGGFRSIYDFPPSVSGSYPVGPLVEGNDAWLYGVTRSGGPFGQGQVFRIKSDGRFEVVHEFGGIVDGRRDGSGPFDSFTKGGDGFLYGVATYGGDYGNGVMYRIDPSTLQYSILNHFAQNGEAGGNPLHPPLVEGGPSSVTLSGTTGLKGAGFTGTMYRLSADGLSVLHTFAADGSEGLQFSAPTGVVRDTDGSLLGLACRGGAFGYGIVFRLTP
jgi:uncharacterized repeat protein (TIGR03803 family)